MIKYSLSLSLVLALAMCQHTKVAVNDYCSIMKDPQQRVKLVKERLQVFTPEERRVLLNQYDTYAKLCRG